MLAATDILSQLNRELTKLTTDKEKLTKPMNEALKEIRSRYKPFEGKLEAAIAYIREQMSTYQTKALQEAEKKQEAIANKVGTKLTLEQATKKLATINEPEQKIEALNGSVSFKTIKKWRVIDLDKVPRAFLTIDEDVVTENMKAGQPIEGIEYYTEQQVVNRR